VTGYLPAPGYTADGRGQSLAQLLGLVALGVPAILLGWGFMSLLNLPYRRPSWLNVRRDRGVPEGMPEAEEELPIDHAELEISLPDDAEVEETDE